MFVPTHTHTHTHTHCICARLALRQHCPHCNTLVHLWGITERGENRQRRGWSEREEEGKGNGRDTITRRENGGMREEQRKRGIDI